MRGDPLRVQRGTDSVTALLLSRLPAQERHCVRLGAWRSNYVVKIKGEPRYYEVTADSGKKRQLGFCATCGSPLFTKLEAMPNVIGITPASLDDPNLFHPSINVYTSSAPAWAIFAEGVRSFPKMPG